MEPKAEAISNSTTKAFASFREQQDKFRGTGVSNIKTAVVHGNTNDNDTYVQAGSHTALTYTGYTGTTYDPSILRVKYSDSTGSQHYTRKTYITFDIDTVSAPNYNKIMLLLDVNTYTTGNTGQA